ncbi:MULTISPECIES: electron transport complex subunit E [Shewanella]|uniref:Ion-translocating oxidoreductase complex subunit E n=1 Tax=Shewanella indica TaxID=768528 RepID=A0ABU4QH82_9GAMM|nr:MULTISPECIES: electron transport complex subunit E [Shewanella]OIN06759.1 electron transport complex subunit RsxE [Shewanella algae]BCV36946.1 electron transport complex subunit E [Shewanella chilikensis]MCE9792673.1 electron transport complex subunit E [Shewanella indica]MDX6018201.1 electron transport complex subunit E [Shewanella indica]NDO75437.1 electron transport complex subunit E [Shewanella sp. SE1]
MSLYRDIAWQGLWKNNPGLVQMLGLCPLLAVTSTFTNALGLGLATAVVLIGSNTTVSLVRNFVPKEIRIPIFVMIIAALVTAVQLLINAYAYGLYLSLGIFLPLIVTNCVIIGRAEAFASRNSPMDAAFDGLMMGIGFTLVLMVLGGGREILGQGTLFDGADLLLGPWAASLRIEVWQVDTPFLLAMLPPGAFLGMGLLIALKNAIDKKLADRQPREQTAPVERARITKVN